MDTGELYWNEVAEGWEAETWPSGNWYVLTGSDERWNLSALVGDDQYSFDFTGDDAQDKAIARAEELCVQASV